MIARHFATAAAKESPLSGGKFRVVVLGGGAGGMAVSSRLASNPLVVQPQQTRDYDGPIAVVEPSSDHKYQPLWTLVGGGLAPYSDSHRPMSQVIEPFKQVMHHVKASATRILPHDNAVILSDGTRISYDYLVVAVGLECQWDKIPGLHQAILDSESRVTSNYHPEAVQRTSKMIKAFQGGTALFTQPSTPIKCAGAPQKIMYLAEEQWRRVSGLRAKSQIGFYSGAAKIFAVDKYARALTEVCKGRGLDVHLNHELVAIENGNMATFRQLQGGGEEIKVGFDFMHATPPMGPASFIRESGLANEGGWMDVDSKLLQSQKYRNVFALGDCSSVPVSKTASAVAAQNSVVAGNLVAQLTADGESGLEPGQSVVETPLLQSYSGYTACPLVTGQSSLIMAEFNGFNLEPRETFWFDQKKESLLMATINQYVLPTVYWEYMLKGKWEGPEPFRTMFSRVSRADIKS